MAAIQICGIRCHFGFAPFHTFWTPFSNFHKPMLNSVIQINPTKVPIHLNGRHTLSLYDAARFFVSQTDPSLVPGMSTQ
jgi:hypothetical protein